jgi:hypothetical protein
MSYFSNTDRQKPHSLSRVVLPTVLEKIIIISVNTIYVCMFGYYTYIHTRLYHNQQIRNIGVE